MVENILYPWLVMRMPLTVLQAIPVEIRAEQASFALSLHGQTVAHCAVFSTLLSGVFFNTFISTELFSYWASSRRVKGNVVDQRKRQNDQLLFFTPEAGKPSSRGIKPRSKYRPELVSDTCLNSVCGSVAAVHVPGEQPSCRVYFRL